MQAELVLDARAEIGESPVWNLDDGTLLWVDILPGLVNRFDPLAGVNTSTAVGQPLGALGLDNDGGLVLAVRDGFAALGAGGEVRLLAEVEAHDLDSRMNDGACDMTGRFWAGTMHADRSPRGSLYRLEPGGSPTRVVSGLALSNGIDWSNDGATMYLVDSLTQCVDAFEFDGDNGTVSNRRHLIEIAPEDGMPDGLTVDAEGCLWVALYRGSQIRCYSPDGRLQLVCRLPVSLVTSCAFGDTDMASLYVTTASRGLDDEARRSEGEAGGVFRLRPGTRGRFPYRFGRPSAARD